MRSRGPGFHAPPVSGCPLPHEFFRLCRSAGRALLSRTSATPELKIEDGTLRGWEGGTERCPTGRLVGPYGVTTIGDKAFHKSNGVVAIEIPRSVTSRHGARG